jgi:uncharacterized protein YutE (UPF0331/DUF86 family)
MIKTAVVLQLLDSLREEITLLRPLQSESLADLTADPVRYNGVLHLLQIAIQHVTDVGAHLLAGSGLALPDEYRQIITKMGQHGILPYDFANRVAPMASFRNIVVHEYLTVDPAQVHEHLQHGLDDFERFIDYVYDYLLREGCLEERPTSLSADL